MGPLLVGSVRAVAIRLLIPWIGAWVIDADLDLASDVPMPSGKVLVSVGGSTLNGTVDPRGSGRKGERAWVRIVAGAGGWDHPVKRQYFHNDAGLKSTDVLTATAGEVGETISEASPADFGIAFARAAGPASSVLEGLSWYVDAAGVTQVRSRSSSKPSADVQIVDWFADEARAELAADTIVWPGTVLEDDRLGKRTIRETEQVFSAEKGSRITAWCTLGDKVSLDATRYHAAMRGLVKRFAGAAHLRSYKYRIVFQNVDGRLVLQAVDGDAGIPDTLPVTIFPGMPGDTADHTLGAECLVQFTEGDPRRPVVHGFADTQPIERRIFALTKVRVGGPVTAPVAFAAPVLLGLGDISILSIAIAAMATAAATFGTAAGTYATAIQPVADPLNTATPPFNTAAGALATAAGALVFACATLQSQLAALIAPIPTVKFEAT